MSGQVGALLGVVIGVLLGGVAQALADRRRNANELELALLDQRREAYTEFLAAVIEGTAPIYQSRLAMSDNGEATAAFASARYKALQGGSGALLRLSVALARVELVAPTDTAFQATLTNAATIGLMVGQDDADGAVTRAVEELVTAQRGFQRLAKRDLGYAEETGLA